MSVAASNRTAISTTSTDSSVYTHPSNQSPPPTAGQLNPVQLTLIQMERTLHSLVDTNDLHPILSSLLFSQLYQIKFAMASLTAEERASHLFDEAHPLPQLTSSQQPRGVKKRRNSISDNSQISNSSCEDIDSFKLRRQEAKDRLRKVGEGIHASIIALQTQIQSYMSSASRSAAPEEPARPVYPSNHLPAATFYPAVQLNNKFPNNQSNPKYPPVTRNHSVPQSHAELTALAAYDLSRDHVEQPIEVSRNDQTWARNRQPNILSSMNSMDYPVEPQQQYHQAPMPQNIPQQSQNFNQQPQHSQSFTQYRQPEVSHQRHQNQQNNFPEYAPGLIDDSILNDGFSYSHYSGSRSNHLSLNPRHIHDPFMPEMDSPIHRSVDIAAFATLCLSDETTSTPSDENEIHVKNEERDAKVTVKNEELNVQS